MLNIGITELLCFAIIALLVLGPDKLPEAARFAAKWYGKFKRMIGSVQNEIDRELRLSEFREEVQKEIERITVLEQRMQEQIDALSKGKSEVSTNNQTTEKLVHDHAYHPAEQKCIPPFSCQYIQHYWHRLPVLEHPLNSLVKLKIAV